MQKQKKTILAGVATIQGDRLLELVNEVRTDAGLAPVGRHPLLDLAATAKAEDLLRHQYFAHSSPDGDRFAKWIEDVQYPFTAVGENLAIDFVTNEGVRDGWLKSESHRENILSPLWRDTGMAVRTGTMNVRESTVVVQLFGTTRPLSTTSSSTAQVAASIHYRAPTHVDMSSLALVLISSAVLFSVIVLISFLHIHARVMPLSSHQQRRFRR